MSFSRDSFLSFCCEITGYSVFDLEGTGLVDTYHQLVQKVLGPQLTEALGERVREVLVYAAGTEERQKAISQSLLPPSHLWPVVSALISLWYLGTWNQLPDTWYAAVGLPTPGPKDVGRTHVPSRARLHRATIVSNFLRSFTWCQGHGIWQLE